MSAYAAASLEPTRRETKKQTERRLAAGALNRMGLGVACIEMQDCPDVMALFPGDQRVGIEVRRIFADEGRAGSAEEKFRGDWIAIMNRVHEKLAVEHPVVPYCVVDFSNTSYEIQRGFPQRQLIAEFVAVGRSLRSASAIVFPVEGLPLLSAFLSSVRVITPDGSGLRWWPSHLQSGTVSNLDEAVAAAIHGKIKLAEKYDWRGARERWLLLAAEAHGLQDVIGGSRPFAVPAEVSTVFTTVMVWDRFSEDIWTIFQTTASSAMAPLNRATSRHFPSLCARSSRARTIRGD